MTARMIAVRTQTGYRAARVQFDKESLVETLEADWRGTMAVHGWVASGDMLTLNGTGAMRVANRKVTRRADTLAELMNNSASEGVHAVSIFDESETTFDQFGDWNMTCEAGDDLFLENIATASCWYHIIDGKMMGDKLSQMKAA